MFGALLGLYLGCGDGGEQDDLGPEDSCSPIVGACHTKDDASPGAINDCHTVGHDNVTSVCQEQYSMCVELCDAAPNVYDTDGMEEDTGDDVADDDDDDDDDDADDGESTAGDTVGPEDTGDETTGGGTTGEPGTTDGGSSSGGDDSSEANCAELGAGCHDTPTPLGMMCHDVGHGVDEAACAEIWVECKEECGF